MPRKKLLSPALAGIGGAVLLGVVIALATRGGSDEDQPVVTPPRPPPKAAPEYSFRIHHQDLGRVHRIALFVRSNVRPKADDFSLEEPGGAIHPAVTADPTEFFLRDAQRDPSALALSFRVEGNPAALDLRLPDGKTRPVYRRPGPETRKPLTTPARYEDWEITASGGFPSEGEFDLEVRARPALDRPLPLDPARFILVTDGGDLLAPEVRTTDPIRIRYRKIPPSARELRLQTDFRSEAPSYLVVAIPAPEPPPGAEPPPQERPAGLREELDRRLAKDPVEALKFLAGKGSDEARSLARGALARAIQEDLNSGLQAFADGDADAAERSLPRAALMADPYAPEFSRQLMRLVFLLKRPGRTPTGCAVCGGAGSSPCGSCKEGQAAGNCPRCETRGRVACVLCEGEGTLPHAGYRGNIVLGIERPFRFTVKIDGNSRSGTMDPQTITYQMGPCAGSGGVQIDFVSVHAETGTETPGSARRSCAEFWTEMVRNVFNGKAGIQVPNKEGQMVPYPPAAARRLFADYEACRGGRVPCDRCAGAKTTRCSLCSGTRSAMLLCLSCEGTSVQACGTCKGYADAGWMARLLPEAPALARALTEQALALREWLDERARRASGRDALAARLEEARKDLDPTAQIEENYVGLACARCAGKGVNCADCWATGRREYFEGTPQYERYALVERLERALAEADATPSAPPGFASLPASEPSGGEVVVIPEVTRRPAGGAAAIPRTLEEMIRKADALHETGRDHLERAKTTTDNATWIAEAELALDDLKGAQTLYATAQEKLDEMGAPVPKDLLRKFRINMQALVIARRTAP
jgi:hypothetical protein